MSPGRRHRSFSWQNAPFPSFSTGAWGEQPTKQTFNKVKFKSFSNWSWFLPTLSYSSSFCRNPHELGALKAGWEQEQKDPGQRCHSSVSGADFFCAVWAVIQQKRPRLWKYVENVSWASCSSFFSSLNYCDPSAKHYSGMDPLKLARGLPGKFNVFLWCLHGTSAEHEWEILQHKRLQLLQRREFREKWRTPVCLTFSFGGC